ncbi:MAG TPA: tyrosine-type recombinase/integrase [Acidimicrobiales bacterium]|nr:tyrosine-type recombinase/integrase [Acidimicrobiales bacterium]
MEHYYRQWAQRQPWRDSSRASIESNFTNHVLPTFGKRPLGSIRRGDVEAWAAQLPLAGTTARLAVQYLGAMLESAVDDGLIAKNPCRGAKRPRVDSEPVVPYTADELDRLWEHAHDWFRIALVLGTMAGLRLGEVAGLTVDRLDLPRRTLKVDRQLVTPTAGTPSFGPPKTSANYRTVPLADVAVENIAGNLEQFGTGREGVVFHENGEWVRRQQFGHLWRKLRVAAGLPLEAKFHATRHTYASTLLSGGVGVPAAAEYLGHTPSVLLKTYAHLMPADHDRARSVVQAAFTRTVESEAAAR